MSDEMNFSNPKEASKEDLAEIFNMGLSFEEKEEVKDAKEEKNPKPIVKATEEETEESTDEDLGLNEEEVVEEDNGYLQIINKLTDAGIIESAFEGFDPETDPDEDTLIKLLEHNQTVAVEKEMTEFFDSLSETTKRILQYDINTDTDSKDTVGTFLKTLVEENNIKSLDVDNEYDQEKILREWYRSEEKFTQAEVDEKMKDLKDANLLEKEARRIKPKLDLKAEEIAKVKEKEQRELKELETKVFQAYSEKVIDTLQKGSIGGIPISKEEATRLYTLMTNDKMEVKIHGNKKAMMNPLEYLMYFNKYDSRGSIENVALATLLLTNPKKFEEAYAKRAETKNTEEFVQQHKFSNKLKLGATQKPSKQKEETPSKWRLKI